jgi:hypothetical protein
MNKKITKAFWDRYMALRKTDPEFVKTIIAVERVAILEYVRNEIERLIKREGQFEDLNTVKFPRRVAEILAKHHGVVVPEDRIE